MQHFNGTDAHAHLSGYAVPPCTTHIHHYSRRTGHCTIHTQCMHILLCMFGFALSSPTHPISTSLQSVWYHTLCIGFPNFQKSTPLNTQGIHSLRFTTLLITHVTVFYVSLLGRLLCMSTIPHSFLHLDIHNRGFYLSCFVVYC